MALKYADRVKETSTTTGTGAISLGGAVTGYETFAANFSTADTCYYTIEGTGANAGEFEVGLGTLTSGSPWTLTRTSVIASSNSNTAVNFSAGTKNVFVTTPSTILALIATAVQNSRQVTGGGLVTGGGDLSSDRTLTVAAAGATEMRGGSDNSKAATAKAAYDAMAEVAITGVSNVFTPDMTAGNDFSISPTANFTLANPSALVVGKKGRFRIVQDSTGSRVITLGSYYKWAGGSAGALSTAANAQDFLDYDVVSSTYVRVGLSKSWG